MLQNNLKKLCIIIAVSCLASTAYAEETMKTEDTMKTASPPEKIQPLTPSDKIQELTPPAEGLEAPSKKRRAKPLEKPQPRGGQTSKKRVHPPCDIDAWMKCIKEAYECVHLKKTNSRGCWKSFLTCDKKAHCQH